MPEPDSVHLSNAPQPNETQARPIIGHEWAVRFLHDLTTPAAAKQGDNGPARGLRHAYLFLGPAQVGKSTLARAFAQAILCTDTQTRPCGKCRACGLMARGAHPDFRVYSPTATDGEIDRVNGMLKAEAANDIVREAMLHPVEAAFKVFLIQDAHTANAWFSNKLLKTLEEPPANVVLCLTALDRGRLLPTIVSRCQVLELRPLPREVLRDGLISRHQATPEQADLLARLANGRMGWAVRQLQAPEDGQRLAQLETLWQLAAAGNVERLAWVDKMATGRNNEQLFGLLEQWITWWRDVLLLKAGCGEACCNVDQAPRLAAFVQAVTQAEIQDYLVTLQRIERYLHHTVNTRLALDVLVLRLPRVTLTIP